MAKEIYSEYKGQIQAIASDLDDLFFCTIHEESNSGFLYRMDAGKEEVAEIDLESPADAILVVGKSVFVGARSGVIYRGTAKSRSVKEFAVLADTAISHLIDLQGRQIVCVSDKSFLVVDEKSGDVVQQIDLPEVITAIAADPTGDWLAIGCKDGTVTVYDREEKDEFVAAESEQLHKGAVTSLLFEPEELRFFSAGSDQKLFLTHARGSLQPEDRGRSNAHENAVTAILYVPGDRILTGSKDKTCKSWARVGATKPQTLSKEVIAVVDMVLVKIHRRMHVAIVCSDNTIRIVLLESSGRFDDLKYKVFDAIGRSKYLLARNDTASRGEALNLLSDIGDSESLETIANQIKHDSDHGIRKRATKLLAESKHPRSTKLLEPLLKHDDGTVRTEAFESLLSRFEQTDLHPLKLALSAKKHDIGVSAIEHIEQLAQTDDIARNELIGALNLDPFEVREAAILSLEKVHEENATEPGLIGLQSKKADVRKLALIRFFQRELLADELVIAAIRRCFEDRDAVVRQAAFLIALLSRKNLATAVRQEDETIHRQLYELENYQFSFEKTSKAKKEKKVPAQPKSKKIKLDDNDLETLISAMASRANDTCLLGATSLAKLGDSRPFGLLLQLSRSPDAEVRVLVCQALAALQDRRSNQRLETLASDSQENVRDAAFSAIVAIAEQHDTPLSAADSGLSSSFADVRKRGLQQLVAFLRAAKKNKKDPDALGLLNRALNDADADVHGEALKATLNLKIDGTEESALKFLLMSVRSEVRKEVLSEVIANKKKDWAWDLLTSLFNDPDKRLRKDAFDEAVKQTKSKDIATMQLGLASEYHDVRLEAIADLKRRRNKEAQAVIATAINDPVEEVRLEALDALVDLESTDAVKSAMQSEHVEVRMKACSARAYLGDPDAKAPLVQLASQPEPLKSQQEALNNWKKNVEGALIGLGHLAHADTFEVVFPYLNHQEPSIRSAAATAIESVADDSTRPVLKQLLQHEDDSVKQSAALALAIQGDATGSPLLFSANHSKEKKLIAADLLGDVTENQLLLLLDDDDQVWRNAAFCVLMFRELFDSKTRPRNCLAALSAQPPRMRLAAAKGLQRLHDQTEFEEYLVEFVNDRGEKPPWKISATTVKELGAVLSVGKPKTRVWALRLLKHLAAEKQSAWRMAWDVFETRFADDIKAAVQEIENNLPEPQIEAEGLNELAFGTYVGLVREEVDQSQLDNLFGTTIVTIRSEAIRRLKAMVDNDANFSASTLPVLVQSLGDPLAPVRQLAFDSLGELGVAVEERAAAAIECGRNDLAIQGLTLLTENAKGKKANAILEQAIRSRSDFLAIDAAKLLVDSIGEVATASIAIESNNRSLRTQAIGWLAEAFDADKKAQKSLRDAVNARYENVRVRAAIALADKKDDLAFDALKDLINVRSKSAGYNVISAICNLDHPEAAQVLVDRIKNDPEKTANVDLLLDFIGELRDATVVPQLQEMIDDFPTFDVIRKIAGYDQPIKDRLEKGTDRSWIDQQHPRNNEIYSNLIQSAIEKGNLKKLLTEATNVQWCQSDQVDHQVELLCSHPDDEVRRRYVRVASWRVKKRSLSQDILVESLKHRDPTTQFHAAEGLAHANNAEGLTVLLSAVEVLSDINLRRDAILALGELADFRALDLLFRIATDKEHALNAFAIQAVGNLKDSNQREKIFELLATTVKKGSDGSAPEKTRRAITGLRFFDSFDAWAIIRQVVWEGIYDGLPASDIDATRFPARTRSFANAQLQNHAIEQLGYNQSEETQELIIELIKESECNLELLYTAARRSFGTESLEPDCAFLKGYYYYYDDMIAKRDEFVKRICENASAEQIFEVIAESNSDEAKQRLTTHLLGQKPLPVKEASAALDSEYDESVSLGARILGKSQDTKYSSSLNKSIDTYLEAWNQTRLRLSDDDAEYDSDFEQQTNTLKRLCWAAGRCSTDKSLMTVFQGNIDDEFFAPVRIAAIQGLANCDLTKKNLGILEDHIDDSNSRIRRNVARILASQASKKMAGISESLLSDRSVFNSVARQGEVDLNQALESGVSTSNYQSVALPHLIQSENVNALAEVANDTEQKESVRFGAIEGMAKIQKAESQSQLVEIGNNETFDKEFRKAAWRGLRRLKRSMAANEEQKS